MFVNCSVYTRKANYIIINSHAPSINTKQSLSLLCPYFLLVQFSAVGSGELSRCDSVSWMEGIKCWLPDINYCIVSLPKPQILPSTSTIWVIHRDFLHHILSQESQQVDFYLLQATLNLIFILFYFFLKWGVRQHIKLRGYSEVFS